MAAQQRSKRRLTSLVALTVLSTAGAFHAGPLLRPHYQRPTFLDQHTRHAPAVEQRSTSTSLNMFMGSDGGLLGVGGPEIFTILLVGYFVLGPSDLYKLVKEIGKFIQNFRTLGQDLTTTFESNMESQLQLEELRKAQGELNDAFSFRRSINVDDSEAFATTVDSPRPGYEAEEAATTTTTAAAAAVTGKKRLRRRKKKVEEQVPNLELPESESETLSETSLSPEEEARINAEFDQYVGDDDDDEESWLETPEASESDTAAAAARFQQQLSGNWNTQILENQDQIEPLADVMQRLAILEQEKSAAEHRLQEEFERRAALETEYYAKQRQVLEEAAAKVQASVYASAGNQTAVPSQS